MNIGDTVVMHESGSWVDGKTGVIEALDVVSSDEIKGHLIRVAGVGVTVVPEEQLDIRTARPLYYVPTHPADRRKAVQRLVEMVGRARVMEFMEWSEAELDAHFAPDTPERLKSDAEQYEIGILRCIEGNKWMPADEIRAILEDR